MEPRRVDCWIRVFASVLVRLCQPSNARSTLLRTCDEPRAQQFTTCAAVLLLALLLLAYRLAQIAGAQQFTTCARFKGAFTCDEPRALRQGEGALKSR